MNKKLFTYKKSGVNIDAADKFVDFISKISSKKKKAIKSLIILVDLALFQVFQKTSKDQKLLPVQMELVQKLK